ncbi:MAG: nitroreductase family protein [Verrucomicrobiales bacterium]|nr:nitroreductase family protein [Verrucomicrobiales bacterium]
MKSNYTFRTLIENRVTASHFALHQEIDDEIIREMLRLATLSPSAFNLQNWHFIAVKSNQAKQQLCDIAFGQAQVKEASVTFIVCGDLDGYRRLGDTLQPSVDAKLLPDSVRNSWVSMVDNLHRENPQLKRDEAFRSASLAAGALMLVAQDCGFASGALSGFDADRVIKEFALREHLIPVMLVTVGYPVANQRPRKIRNPVNSILEFR